MNTIMARVASAALIAAALLVVPAVSLPVPRLAIPALANTACGSSANYGYHDGWNGTQDTWGSFAVIETRDAHWCTTGANGNDVIDSSAMLQDHNAAIGLSNIGNWMQMGYWSLPGYSGSFYLWGEYTNTGCTNRQCMWASNTRTYGGEQHSDDVKYVKASYGNFMGGYVDGTLRLNTAYDPVAVNNANYWPGAWRASWFGETHNSGDDVPGSVNYPVLFNNLEYYPNIGSAAAISGHNAASDFCYYHHYGLGATSFEIWTAAC